MIKRVRIGKFVWQKIHRNIVKNPFLRPLESRVMWPMRARKEVICSNFVCSKQNCNGFCHALHHRGAHGKVNSRNVFDLMQPLPVGDHWWRKWLGGDKNICFLNHTSSPYLSSGTPKATACAMSRWDRSTASTSIGDIFSPEKMQKNVIFTMNSCYLSI